MGRRLHNVAITVGAIGRIVDDRKRIARLRERGCAQRYAAVRQHLMAAHGDAGPVRRLRRQLLLRRLRAGAGARHRRRRGLRRAHHARRARARAVRAVQAARRARARHARSRVKVRRLCWPAISGYFLFSTRPHNLPTLPNNKSPRNICTSNKNFARSYLRTLPTETFHRHPKSSKFLNENQFWLAICATVSARAHRPTYVMSLSHSSQMFCPGGKPPVLLMGASGRVTGACT